MIKILNIFFCSLLFFYSLEAIANNFNNCPSFDGSSYLTQNNYGNSSYANPELINYFNSLTKLTKFNLKDPILDVGAGYGMASFELIKLGAKNIYVNDLDKRNLECMQANINRVYSNRNLNLTYLPGDIVSNQVLSQLPDHYFGLIYAQSVIHFFTYDKLIKFIKILNKKAKKDGIVTIAFENPYINTLNRMVEIIFSFHKKYPQYSFSDATEAVYEKIEFPGHRHCSVDTYKHAMSNMKIPGFPCELPLNVGVGQLLLPDIIITLMNAAGFDNIAWKSYHNHDNGQFLVFIKKNNMSENRVNKNIEIMFKKQIEEIATNKL